MLQTAAYFIVSSLKRRNLVRELQKRSYNVLHSLSVDYLGIYQVNFDTDECEIYRDSEQVSMDWNVSFVDGYQTAMKQYISGIPGSGTDPHCDEKSLCACSAKEQKEILCPVSGEG